MFSCKSLITSPAPQPTSQMVFGCRRFFSIILRMYLTLNGDSSICQSCHPWSSSEGFRRSLRALADVGVKKFTGHGQRTVRKSGGDLPREPNPPAIGRGELCRRRAAPVGQGGAIRRPALLVGDQARVVAVRPSQVELFSPGLLGVLNGFPEEERHATEIVQAPIGASVLVDDPFPVAQR